jgi:hypothetical protein
MMLRIALWGCGAAIALYLIWNLLQIIVGIFRERRSDKSKKADHTT